MAKKEETGTKAFGQFVSAKLREKGWSQRRLGGMINRSSSYVSYIIRGENPSVRGRKFWLRPDVVKAIAVALDIPVDEAIRVSGIDPYSVREVPKGSEPASAGKAAHGSKGKTKPGEDLFDIAYEAALKAVGAEPGSGPVRAATRVKIKLQPNMDLVLRSDEELSEDEIARYTLGIRIAFETVRQQIATERGGE